MLVNMHYSPCCQENKTLSLFFCFSQFIFIRFMLFDIYITHTKYLFYITYTYTVVPRFIRHVAGQISDMS